MENTGPRMPMGIWGSGSRMSNGIWSKKPMFVENSVKTLVSLCEKKSLTGSIIVLSMIGVLWKT